MTREEVDIMGNVYKILFLENEEEKKKYPRICGCDGIILTSSKMILINAEKLNYSDDEGGIDANNIPYINETLRHEIIHAYLNECGLKSDASGTDCWARNEEMVDWFACISPRIFKTFKQLNIL